MIRPARFADVPAIVDILLHGHARSPYEGKVNVDVKEAKNLLVNCINRHGRQKVGAAWVMVAETDGQVTGFILGLIERVYHIGDRLSASDLFWLCLPQVDPRDPGRLLDSFIAWAESCPGVHEIVCGATNVVADHKRTSKALQKRRFAHYGAIYRKEVKRT